MGVTPRRNPELVVAVLWQNGEFSYYPARIGAEVVSAYVDKQRRLAHNLVPDKVPAAPVEMGAVWTSPNRAQAGKQAGDGARMQAEHFLVKDGQIVAQRADARRHPAARQTATAQSWRGSRKPGRRSSAASLAQAAAEGR